jgi:hypothetical protein
MTLAHSSLPLSRRMTLAATVALAGAGTDPPTAVEASLWSANYWAVKRRDARNIRLAMYRKRRGAPEPGEPARPVLFLVHGSSSAARSSFDLAVPGHGEYSTMNVFARVGFDVWTMDHEGYGQSSRTEGNSDVASGVEDLKAAVDVVAHETGLTGCSGRHPRRRLRGCCTGSRGQVGACGFHLYRQRFSHPHQARRGSRVLSDAQSPPA